MSEKFNQIKLKYIKTFSDKKDEIKSAWDNKDVAHVHELMHKLAGSSGGYGFHELYNLVLRGMELSDNHYESNHQELNECIERINDTLIKMYHLHFQEV